MTITTPSMYGRRYHAHLVGYTRIAKTLPPAHYVSVADTNGDILAARATTKTYVSNSRAKASVVLDLHSNGGNSLDHLPSPLINPLIFF